MSDTEEAVRAAKLVCEAKRKILSKARIAVRTAQDDYDASRTVLQSAIIAHESELMRQAREGPKPVAAEPGLRRSRVVMKAPAPHRTLTARLMGDPPPGRTEWS